MSSTHSPSLSRLLVTILRTFSTLSRDEAATNTSTTLIPSRLLFLQLSRTQKLTPENEVNTELTFGEAGPDAGIVTTVAVARSTLALPPEPD